MEEVTVLREAIKKHGIDHVQVEFSESSRSGHGNIACRIGDEDGVLTFTRFLNGLGASPLDIPLSLLRNNSSSKAEFQIDIGFSGGDRKKYMGWIYEIEPNDIVMRFSDSDDDFRKDRWSGKLRSYNSVASIERIRKQCLKCSRAGEQDCVALTDDGSRRGS